MTIQYYVDTSGSISPQLMADMISEMKAIFKADRIKRKAFLVWQRRNRPERARNRMRRISRRKNR